MTCYNTTVGLDEIKYGITKSGEAHLQDNIVDMKYDYLKTLLVSRNSTHVS